MGIASGMGGGGKGGGLLGNVIQQIAAQNPQTQNNFTYTQSQPNQYNVDYAKYTAQPTNQNFNQPISKLKIDNGVYEFFKPLDGFECVPSIVLKEHDYLVYNR